MENNKKQLDILCVDTPGRAAPHCIMDYRDAFLRMGHNAFLMHPAFVEEHLHRHTPDLAIGYGWNGTIPPMDGPRACIFWDNPLPGLRPDLIQDNTYLFIWDKHWVNQTLVYGLQNVQYLPIASNTRRFKPPPEITPESISQYHCDASFVGSHTLQREVFLAQLLEAGVQLRIYGHDWDRVRTQKLLFALSCRGPADNRLELPKIYYYSTINLNITALQGIESVNMRVLDCFASGGFALSDPKSDIEELLGVRSFYSTIHAIPELIARLKKNPELRQRVIAEANRNIAENHTFDHRAEQILKTVGLWEEPEEAPHDTP